MTDRPTGPATRRRSDSLTPAQHAAFMEGMKLGEKAGRAYSCHEAAAAERARILAVLPEALARLWLYDSDAREGWPTAAALAAAIERVLGEETPPSAQDIVDRAEMEEWATGRLGKPEQGEETV